MEKSKLMQLEIEEKRKLPHEVKENIKTNIFHNLIVAAIILAYFAAINIFYYCFDSKMFLYYMKYFALGIIIVTVIDIELAYRKNSKKLWIIGLELLACGILSLYIPYIYVHTTAYLRNSVMILPAGLLMYYIFKSIVIFKQNQFKYINNLSDVKELLNDDRTSYLDEKSIKSYRAKMEEEEEIRKVIIKRQKLKTIEKEQANKKEKNKIKSNKRKQKNKRKEVYKID